MSATQAPTEGIEVCNTLEVRGSTLVVNVNKWEGASTYKLTVAIPLEHVLGAEADPQIERTIWRAWVFGQHGLWRSRIFGTDGEYRVPDPGVRFYNPRHSCADKAVVVRLRDEDCERLVVEVEEPSGGSTGPSRPPRTRLPELRELVRSPRPRSLVRG